MAPPMRRSIPAFATLILGSAGLSALAFVPMQGAGLGLPSEPAANPSTPAKNVLGKMLFWEEQLSTDNSVACGTCHIPGKGATDPRQEAHPHQLLDDPVDDVFTSPGIVRRDASKHMVPDPIFDLGVQLTPRRTNDNIGALYQDEIFWDGRAGDVFTDPETGLVSIPSGGAMETQALDPILSPVEMGHEGRTWDQVKTKLAAARPMRLATNLTPDMIAALAVDPTYPELFEEAFGTPDITAERIAFALASYQRQLVPNQTPWDDYVNGNLNALTPEQEEGWFQFNGIARCNLCHTPPVFSDGDFHNTGLRHWSADIGREEVTGNIADRAKFKTPSLRNMGLRDNFFHTGASGFNQVRTIYNNGGGLFVALLDPLLQPIANVPGLDWPKIRDFLTVGLTDPRAAAEVFPFDRPTLYSERVPLRSNVFGSAVVGLSQQIPVITGNEQPAFIGNDRFEIGVWRALSNAPGWLVISTHEGPWSGPGGLPFNVAPPMAVVEHRFLGGTGTDDGWASVPVPIPNKPQLVGRTIFAQWIVEDPGAPNGFASTTKGAEFTILP